MLPIITIPHPNLRQVAQPVTEATPGLSAFIKELVDTLQKKRNPAGVGLAAPQVNKLWRIFVTKVDPAGRENSRKAALQVFINPTIVAHSPTMTLGQDPENPTLEGCLSMPGLYGPVPRWQWVEVEFETLQRGKLIKQTARYEAFAARVVQHEYDHLEGVLFTDYAIDTDLPVFKEDKKGKLIEIEDRALLAYL
jgi:peptide deformylase